MAYTENDFEKMYGSSLRYLTGSARTEHEVRTKLHSLLKRKYMSHVNVDDRDQLVDDVVERLYEIDLLDDSQFAQDYVNQRIQASKPKSKLQISNFLYKKGVPKHEIDLALTVYTDEIEYAMIEKALQNRELSKESKNKDIKYLTSKGYSFSKSIELVNSTIEAEM